MTRRFVTAEDVRRAGAELLVDADTVVTPQALEVARSLGVALVAPDGERAAADAWVEPLPDRGPDIEIASQAPPLPEPEERAEDGTGVVIAVVGRNRPGVLAELTGAIARLGVNVDDISQKMVGEYFHLVLLVTVPESGSFDTLKTTLECMGEPKDYGVRVMHERVFRFMHRV